jgi:hypothetical protein
VRCSATVEVKVSDFAALANAAATAAPNTQPYDASTTQDSPTHAAADQYGVKNCLYNGWTSWSTCSRKCGGGQRTRSAKVTQLPDAGGAACPKDQVQACNISHEGVEEEGDRVCNNVDCVLQQPGWAQWSECSVSGMRNGVALECGNGQKTRVPIIATDPKDYGAACPNKQIASCNTNSCYDQLPRCECNPFADNDGTQVQTDPNQPGKTIHSDSDTTCTVEPIAGKGALLSDGQSGRIRMTHTTGHVGGKVVCQHKDGLCKCCTCRHLMCHSTIWGSWSSCAVSEGIKTQVRTRTMPGSSLVGDAWLTIEVDQRSLKLAHHTSLKHGSHTLLWSL